MALRDPDGFIRLIDRKKNLIISGGENIYPSEVENVIGAHTSVRDVAVVGLPDPLWGERVHACVVLHEGMNASEADLIDWSREKLAGFKRPRTVSFVADAEMPRTATGKNLHRELRERLTKENP
jgi:fatty-acyl-CoA synthase